MFSLSKLKQIYHTIKSKYILKFIVEVSDTSWVENKNSWSILKNSNFKNCSILSEMSTKNVLFRNKKCHRAKRIDLVIRN